MIRFFRAPTISVLLASTLLAGCGIFGRQVTLEFTEADLQQCPPVGIVAYTGQLTRFGPGPDRTTDNVAYRAQISNLTVTCKNNEAETGVVAAISFDIGGTRGPAAQSSYIDLPYFISVTRGSEAVLSKKVYTASLTLGPGVNKVSEYATAFVPFDAEGNVVDEEILIGFQLSREELGYNVAR